MPVGVFNLNENAMEGGPGFYTEHSATSECHVHLQNVEWVCCRSDFLHIAKADFSHISACHWIQDTSGYNTLEPLLLAADV